MVRPTNIGLIKPAHKNTESTFYSAIATVAHDGAAGGGVLDILHATAAHDGAAGDAVCAYDILGATAADDSAAGGALDVNVLAATAAENGPAGRAVSKYLYFTLVLRPADRAAVNLESAATVYCVTDIGVAGRDRIGLAGSDGHAHGSPPYDGQK